jgi:hypothetical protein
MHDVLMGSSFSRHHVPSSRAPHHDLARARRMFDPDDFWYVFNELRNTHLLSTRPMTRDGWRLTIFN